MDFLLDSATRLDWGLGNPNKTAILMAQWLIIFLAITLYAPIRQPWRAWRLGGWLLAVLFCAIMMWCLLLTQSRGGLVAWACGGVVLLWYAPRPWLWPRMAAVLLVLCLVIGAARELGVTMRLATVTPQTDDSIAHRLEIWQAAPRMMLDAPFGWGWDKPARPICSGISLWAGRKSIARWSTAI